MEHWFAPVLNPVLTSTTVPARARAEWGIPVAAKNILPFTISECWFYYQTGATAGVAW